MAEDSDAERTEDPTPRRLEEARNKGQVARSHELVTFSVLAAGLGALIATSAALMGTIKQVMVRNLTFDHTSLVHPDEMLVRAHDSLQDALLAVLPIPAATAIAAIFASMLVSGWIFTFEAIEPKFEKLNPASGIARIFSARGLVEMAKAILKSALIGGVAIMTIWSEKGELVALLSMPALTALPKLWALAKFTLSMVVGSMLVIVLIDVPFQIWQYRKGLRMTKQEIKQESRESEGDPQIKAKVRQLQMAAARKRMMTEIPKANVVVTNPTHYAVALQYNESMKAPIVIAKGSFLLAERIIEVGNEHKIPVLRTPPLARALYHHAELGQEIPANLFTAVAEVLAYLYQLDIWQMNGGFEPQLPDTLSVPPELDPEGEA